MDVLTYGYRPQLASKLAASQGGAPPGGAYPPQPQKAGAYVCHRNSQHARSLHTKPALARTKPISSLPWCKLGKRSFLQSSPVIHPLVPSIALPPKRAITIPSDTPTMTHRPDQPYPGKLNPGYQPPYPSTSPQPPYPQNPQPPQYNQQPPYGQPAQYNNRISYERPPPPPPPQQYGGYQQQPPYGQPAQIYQRSPYPPIPGPAYVRVAECNFSPTILCECDADIAGDYRDNQASTPRNNRVATPVKAVNNMGLRNSKGRIPVKVASNMEAPLRSRLVPTSSCFKLVSRRTICRTCTRQTTRALTCTQTKRYLRWTNCARNGACQGRLVKTS